jgi:hypothetical protein
MTREARLVRRIVFRHAVTNARTPAAESKGLAERRARALRRGQGRKSPVVPPNSGQEVTAND